MGHSVIKVNTRAVHVLSPKQLSDSIVITFSAKQKLFNIIFLGKQFSQWTHIDMGDAEYNHLQDSSKTSDRYSREIALRVSQYILLSSYQSCTEYMSNFLCRNFKKCHLIVQIYPLQVSYAMSCPSSKTCCQIYVFIST